MGKGTSLAASEQVPWEVGRWHLVPITWFLQYVFTMGILENIFCFKAHLLPLDWPISASAVVPAISREGFSAASLLQEPGRGAALLVVLYLQNCGPKSEVSDTASQSWVCACDRQTAVTASREV